MHVDFVTGKIKKTEAVEKMYYLFQEHDDTIQKKKYMLFPAKVCFNRSFYASLYFDRQDIPYVSAYEITNIKG